MKNFAIDGEYSKLESLFLFATYTVEHLAIPDFEFRRFPGEMVAFFFLKTTRLKCYSGDFNWKFVLNPQEMSCFSDQN